MIDRRQNCKYEFLLCFSDAEYTHGRAYFNELRLSSLSVFVLLKGTEEIIRFVARNIVQKKFFAQSTFDPTQRSLHYMEGGFVVQFLDYPILFQKKNLKKKYKLIQ